MREALARLAGKALRLGLLAETRCPGCGRAMQAAAGALCPDCAADCAVGGRCGALRVEAPEAGEPCPGCGEVPLPRQELSALCGRCRETPRPWTRLVAAGPYDGELRELILGYKFEDRLDFGLRLQQLALAAFERGVERFPELAGCELVAPVPLHPRRLLARGFNQSLELARLLASRRNLPLLPDVLLRVRRTVPQMELKREERALNIRGAFAARAEGLAGRSALLVDDIMTTGSTLEECARALLSAGARRVDVLVLARA